MATLTVARPRPLYKGSTRSLVLGRGTPLSSKHAFTDLPRDRRASIHKSARTYCRDNGIPRGAHRMDTRSPGYWKFYAIFDGAVAAFLLVLGTLEMLAWDESAYVWIVDYFFGVALGILSIRSYRTWRWMTQPPQFEGRGDPVA